MQQGMNHEFMQITQAGNETITQFMARVQATIDKAFRKYSEEVKHHIAFAKFCSGLTDKDAARIVSMHAKGSVSRALRIASSLLAYTGVLSISRVRPYIREKYLYSFNLHDGNMEDAE